MTTCFHCHQQTTESEYARTVHNKTPLYGPWSGWRMAGRYLVGPGGERINPERLRGILWSEENQVRKRPQKAGLHGSAVKVVIVPLSDWQLKHFGSRAG